MLDRPFTVHPPTPCLVDDWEIFVRFVEVFAANLVLPGHTTQKAKHRFSAVTTIAHLDARVMFEISLQGRSARSCTWRQESWTVTLKRGPEDHPTSQNHSGFSMLLMYLTEYDWGLSHLQMSAPLKTSNFMHHAMPVMGHALPFPPVIPTSHSSSCFHHTWHCGYISYLSRDLGWPGGPRKPLGMARNREENCSHSRRDNRQWSHRWNFPQRKTAHHRPWKLVGGGNESSNMCVCI